MLNKMARELIDGKNAATVATINKNGLPQLSVVFVGREDDTLVFSTIEGRLKTRNMKRDPRVTVLIIAPQNPGKYVEIRGDVELVADPDKVLLKEMYAKYLGGEPPEAPEEQRLIVRVTPTKVVCFPPVS
jgi:PPOX class probable F420-dependent enzyme